MFPEARSEQTFCNESHYPASYIILNQIFMNFHFSSSKIQINLSNANKACGIEGDPTYGYP